MLLDLLDRPIAFNPVFKKITGCTVAALMLSQGIYWQKKADAGKGGDGAGWWWKSQKEWEQEIGLTRSEQETARNCLKKLHFLHEERRGLPARIFYRIDFDRIEKSLKEQQYTCSSPGEGPPPKIEKNKADQNKKIHAIHEIHEYVSLAAENGKCSNPDGLKRHLIKNGMNSDHFADLEKWKKQKAEKIKKDNKSKELAHKNEKEKIKKENEIEKIWNYFESLPSNEKEKMIADFRASLPAMMQRDFSFSRPSCLFSFRDWLPGKIMMQNQ